MFYCGIDPGADGAVVALDAAGKIEAYFIGTDRYELTAFLQAIPCQSIIFIEHAQAMPKNGSVSMFNYGVNFGSILGVCSALSFQFKLIKPRVWTKCMHEGLPRDISPKERSLLRFEALYPGMQLKRSERCKKQHSGLIDAVLIARFGLFECVRNIKPL